MEDISLSRTASMDFFRTTPPPESPSSLADEVLSCAPTLRAQLILLSVSGLLWYFALPAIAQRVVRPYAESAPWRDRWAGFWTGWFQKSLQLHGLPADAFSIDSGVIMTKARNPPLFIDPQTTATRWIRQQEKQRGLRLLRLTDADYIRVLESAVSSGVSSPIAHSAVAVVSVVVPSLPSSPITRATVAVAVAVTFVAASLNFNSSQQTNKLRAGVVCARQQTSKLSTGVVCAIQQTDKLRAGVVCAIQQTDKLRRRVRANKVTN